MKPKVYFIRDISPESVMRIYGALGVSLPGKVAAKVHSGEKGNKNFLRPEFWKPIINKLGASVVECNTAYEGARNTAEKHFELMQYHGWSKEFDVDIMDAEGPDFRVPVIGGKVLAENLLGKDILNYDSMLVLSHFKGHPCGGYGGALKQLSIGCASSAGKCLIHSAGVTDSQDEVWKFMAEQDKFLEAMADAALTVVNLFEDRIAYINVMANISIDCDCVYNAEPPCMQDIGILASRDPVALDQACVDMIYAAKSDPGREHFLERFEVLHGIHTIEAAEEIGIGSRKYEFVLM